MSISSFSSSFGSPRRFILPWETFKSAVIDTTVKAYQKMKADRVASRTWDEDTFTIRLKKYIHFQIGHDDLPLQVQTHAKVYTKEMKSGKVAVKNASEIDIKLYRSSDLESDEIYFAWECKLIGKQNSNLVSRYIKNGICRFIREDYSTDLDTAGMIGYVLDSETHVLVEKINVSMLKRTGDIPFSQDDHLNQTDATMDFADVFISQHNRLKNTSSIRLYHLFMTFDWV